MVDLLLCYGINYSLTHCNDWLYWGLFYTNWWLIFALLVEYYGGFFMQSKSRIKGVKSDWLWLWKVPGKRFNN